MQPLSTCSSTVVDPELGGCIAIRRSAGFLGLDNFIETQGWKTRDPNRCPGASSGDAFVICATPVGAIK